MRDLAKLAVDTAAKRGATYADARAIAIDHEDLAVRNGEIATLDRGESAGVGVRVIAGGRWGFAATSDLSRAAIERAAALAVDQARAAGRVRARDEIRLVPEPVYRDRWHTPYLLDPFAVSLEEKLGLLYAIDETLRKDKRVAEAHAQMRFGKERQWLETSEGTSIDQLLLESGAGYGATAVGDGEMQTRSYPSSHGGQNQTGGYEIVPALKLLENADRVRDEAVALLTAPVCPNTTADIVLDGSQLALQIHESCGHATELDRVLGIEEAFAGRSFLTLDKHGAAFEYGSPHVNLYGDCTIPGGLATFGYDDDGVRAQRFDIVKEGRFVGYLTNREFARFAGGERSNGCCRADGWNRLPMIRMPNLCLAPGDARFDDLLADTEGGIYMETNRSWSIDQLRLNFQFGCEAAWEIKNGKKGRLLRNPTYQGITPEFWRSCDAICGPEHWYLWGVGTCGKGQPMQTGAMSHGAAPARFRRVRVGVQN